MKLPPIAGLSYASTGSLAYPLRTHCVRRPRQELLAVVLEFVHPGNLGPLPPAPETIALKGEQIGLAKYGEFFKEVWF